jgi:hypothetical protein
MKTLKELVEDGKVKIHSTYDSEVEQLTRQEGY